MPPLALDCPLCCNETFASKDSLKCHLLDTIDNLRCRICNSRCSDILELVEHLEQNCGKGDVVRIKTEETTEDYEDVPQMVEDEDVPLEQSQDGNTGENLDNDPNGMYSCLMCDMTFSSIEKHLEKYHDGEEVLLETDELGDESQDVENDEQFEDEEFIEEPNNAVDPLGDTNQNDSADDVTNMDHENELEDGDSQGPPQPIVEKYLFDKVYKPQILLHQSQKTNTKRRKCCVPCCIYRKKAAPRHRFPKNEPEIFQIWLDRIRPAGFESMTVEEIYNRFVVCENHFHPSCFDHGSRRGIIRTALPTLNLPCFKRGIPKRRCCVPKCDNVGPYHGFPSYRSKPTEFKTWLEIVKPKDWDTKPWNMLYSRYRICREHFAPDCFCVNSGRIRLKRNVIPTLNVPGFDSQKFFKPEPTKSRTCDKYIKVIEDAIAGLDKTKRSPNSVGGSSNSSILIFKGEVRLLQDSEADSVKDKSKISEILRCPTCTLKFPNVTHYDKHKCLKDSAKLRAGSKQRKNVKQPSAEAVEGKYKCTFCLVRFSTLKDINDHMKSHLVTDESGKIIPNTVAMSLHVCKECNTKFPTLKSLRLHAKMHKPVPEKEVEPPVDYNIMGETPEDDPKHETFECSECGKEFDMKYKEAHLKSHTEESEYNCSVCNKKFFSSTNLEMHMKVHTDVKKFTCSYCKKLFNTYEAMEEHTKKECLQKAYECQYCGRRFSKPHEKVKHERIHTGEKPHICQICGKGFRVSFCLTLHMRTHTGTRPYMCNQCGKRFKSNGVYVHHLKTHSDVRNYKCPYCAKAFKTSVQLSSHKNSHTKPFSCTECNRPFASLYAVRTHMATHQKENNLKYDCWLCGATYARSFALKDHMNSVHMDYSITGEQNGDVETLNAEEDGEVEYEEVDEDGQMQIEFQEASCEEVEAVKHEVTGVEVVEA